ncbi:MAG: ABC transporter ATP-binding protein [Chloroflexi bacterium CFX7]|nr:ABC transporter ATP-binding protein [Chloroflexi bacterium CFX7]MCK6566013.1 ABC transporter ATP-binding protein/permease [Dehalococcoidia bacterium]MCL4232741.1 ABC transporter ATP-binding protein/permease [Dehalococcoidia bacterium]
MKYLLRLIHYLRPYKGQLLLAWVCVLVAGAFVMISPLAIRYAIDFGLKPIEEAYQTSGGETRHRLVGLDGNERLLIFAGLGVILFAVGRGIAAFGQQFLGESIGQRVAYDIRNDIYNNLQRLSYAYHDKVESGQVMSRATQDVEAIRMFINMGALRLGYVVLILLIAMVGMFVINWQLALVSSLSLPILAWRSILVSSRMRPIWTQIQQNQAEVTQVAEEGLTGIRVVKAFSREPFESQKFRDKAQKQADLNYYQATQMARHQPLMQGISAAQIGLTVGVGSLLIARGSLSAADLLTFTLWLNLLQLPVRTLGFVINIVARCISSAERVFELIDAQSAVQEKPGAQALPTAQGNVVFDHVSFGYESASPVLSEVSIDAKPGEVIALLGPTGSGKSTIVNLIPRFYDVTGGQVLIDGHDVRDVTLDSLRRNIGIVQQDVFLFIGTIRDNISYGKPEATQEEIERAAKAARIHDFIMSLPYGYDEWVGERGVTLSGGQKQRIAIARTLLLDPKILIFDDSTSSVDAQTEFLIQQALHELMEGRTTFVIAQRLRTIMRADQIIVLDRGRVAQRGKHAELLQQEGLYRRIYDLELKDQEEALGRVPAAPAADGERPPGADGTRSQPPLRPLVPPQVRASEGGAS